MSPYLLVLLSFLLIIVLGSILLLFPFSHTNGQWGNYVESLFIATSATCITGFDCFQNSITNELTFFGQLIVAIMVQIGGLGLITVLVFFITLFRRKLSFKDRAYLSQAVNSDNIKDVTSFVRKLFLVTLLIEIIGTILIVPSTLTVYENPWEAIWSAFFVSLNSFNNAGFDVFGTSSIIQHSTTSVVGNMPEWAYYQLIITMMILMVVGGISYLTLFEIFSFKKKPRQWSVFTKICLVMTAILVIGGAGLIALTECTKGADSMDIVQALFQSISSRTSGFSTYDPNNISAGGKIITGILMFIGGCPLGTASGIKTTTIFIIMVTIYCYIRGQKVSAFKRYFTQNTIVKAMAVFIASLTIVLAGYFALIMFEINNVKAEGGTVLFEVISAYANVGFTTDITTSTSEGGKITLCILMFIGRLGPMSMFSIFSDNMNVEEKKHYQLVEEDILVG